jgi:hypothetical protein
MFFSKNKNPSEIYFICDLGSSSVAGSLVLIRPNKKAKVFWQRRIHLNFSKEDHRSELSVLKKELKHLVCQADAFLFKNKHGKVNEVEISVSSPWYLSRLRKEDIKMGSSFVVTHDDLKNIVESASESLRVEILGKKNQQSEYFKSGSVVIEQQTFGLKVNGYNIPNPINMRARDLELSMMLSVIPRDLNIFLNSIFDSYWSNVNFKISSFPYTHFNALKYLSMLDGDKVLIDVSGWETEFTYIKKGAISEINYTKTGRNHFNETILEVLNLEPFMAESELKLFMGGDSTLKQEADLSFILKNLENKWKTEIKDLIMKDENRAERKYVLTSDPGSYKYFRDLLVKVFEDISSETEIKVSSSEYEHDNIEYESNISKDNYIELGILSLLNRK